MAKRFIFFSFFFFDDLSPAYDISQFCSRLLFRSFARFSFSLIKIEGIAKFLTAISTAHSRNWEDTKTTFSMFTINKKAKWTSNTRKNMRISRRKTKKSTDEFLFERKINIHGRTKRMSKRIFKYKRLFGWKMLRMPHHTRVPSVWPFKVQDLELKNCVDAKRTKQAENKWY